MPTSGYNDVTASSADPLSIAAQLHGPSIILAPGVYDALTASIAANAGFRTLYVSGAAIAYTRLGRPDIGLVTMSEVAETVALIRDRVPTPLIVDADTGFGNALNLQRMVRLFERMGANALQIEDQTFPKRCGHLSDKTLIAAEEMAGKIKAAVDSRASEQTLIVARTDAIAVEGFERAMERAELYARAGADILFVEAPGSAADLEAVPKRLGILKPLLANMVEGGRTPIRSAPDLQALGYKIVIFPGAIVRALARAATSFYQTLAQDGTTQEFRDRMFDFAAINEVVETAAHMQAGRTYERFAPDERPGDAP
jgi:2-methylisocitrate lyase-like PEP mutase family enzyme